MNNSYKKLKRQISYTAAYKVIILALNYILIALLIKYLGQENFGIYIALTSLFSWMFLFDIGIAKGMRNFVTVSLADKNIIEAKKYISTAYVSIFFLTTIACGLILSLLSHFDIQKFLNIKIDNDYLQKVFFILIIGFFLKFYFSTVDQLNYATHKSQNVSLNSLFVVFINFTGVYLLWKMEYVSSILFAIFIFSFSIVLPYIYSTFSFFFKNRELIPTTKSFSKIALKNILGKGSKILYIQVGFLCIIGLDRLILLKFDAPNEVFKYEIIYKVMSIIIFPISIIMEPLWSSFSEAYHKGDVKWIKSVFRKFYVLLFFATSGMIILTFFFKEITYLWISQKIDVSFTSILLVGFLILSIVVGNFYSSFLLGNNKLKFMSIIISIGLVAKFLFLNYTSNNIEINNVVLSSLIAYSIFIFSTPFYIKRILKNVKS